MVHEQKDEREGERRRKTLWLDDRKSYNNICKGALGA